MTLEEVKEKVRDSAMVLIGLGEDLDGELGRFYEALSALIHKKNYYIVTLQGRAELEKAGIRADRIAAPLDENEEETSWEKYLHWLGFTLNQKLCILELGVGFRYPDAVRFPFEKTSYFNQKSHFIRINKRFPQLSEEIADRGFSIKTDPVEFFSQKEESYDSDH